MEDSYQTALLPALSKDHTALTKPYHKLDQKFSESQSTKMKDEFSQKNISSRDF